MASLATTAQQRQRLYELLDRARAQTGGWRYLYSCEKDGIPPRGVYFFFDEKEPTPSPHHCTRIASPAQKLLVADPENPTSRYQYWNLQVSPIWATTEPDGVGIWYMFTEACTLAPNRTFWL